MLSKRVDLRPDTQSTIIQEMGGSSKGAPAVLMINVICRSRRAPTDIIAIVGDCGSLQLPSAAMRGQNVLVQTGSMVVQWPHT